MILRLTLVLWVFVLLHPDGLRAQQCVADGPGVTAEGSAFGSEVGGNRTAESSGAATEGSDGSAASFSDTAGPQNNQTSMTSGTADDCGSEVTSSAAGDQANAGILTLATANSMAMVSCGECCVGNGRTDLLTIDGTPITVPEDQPPNTTVATSTFNRQDCNADLETLSASFTVDALRDDVLGITLAESSGTLRDLPPTCAIFAGLLALDKTGELVLDSGAPGAADIGDRVRFEIMVSNLSGQAGQGCVGTTPIRAVQVLIRDRLPREIVADPASFTVQGPGDAAPSPVAAMIAACPAEVSFTQNGRGDGAPLCADDPQSGSMCALINVGDLLSGEDAVVAFEAGVIGVDGRSTDICNPAVVANSAGAEARIAGVEPTPIPTVAPTPPANIVGDDLITVGGGGCSIRATSSAAGDDWIAVALLCAIVWFQRRADRRWRSKEKDGADG